MGRCTLTIPSGTGYAPNSDILTANDSVNGNWAYAYDDFNRLASATQAAQPAYTDVYDRYGNRWKQLYNGACTAGSTFCANSFDGNNHNSNGLLVYDAAGNVTMDNMHHYAYDGENRVVSSGAISYYAEDFIGSSRVITTSLGATCYDADFYPYGSESNVTNTCPQNYKWTGKERDAETGNDDFDARYYSSVYGRFLSADWSAVPVAVPYANLTNPQTLNLYAIVRDNPESFVDLDGHLWTPGGAGQCGDPTSGCGGSDQNAAANNAQKAQQNAKQNNEQTRANVAATAEKYNGSTDWGYSKQKGAFACNTNKCNAFEGT